MGDLERATEYPMMQKDILNRDRMDFASALGLQERMAESRTEEAPQQRRVRVDAMETSKEAFEAMNPRLQAKEEEVAESASKLKEEKESRGKLDREAVEKEKTCKRLQRMAEYMGKQTEEAKAQLVRTNQAAAIDQARLVTDLEKKLKETQGELAGERQRLHRLERSSRSLTECLEAQMNQLRSRFQAAKQSEADLRRSQGPASENVDGGDVSTVADEEVAQRLAELTAEADRASALEVKLAELERAHKEELARVQAMASDAAHESKEERARDNLEKLERIDSTLSRHASKLSEDTKEFLVKEMSCREEAQRLAAVNETLQARMEALEQEKQQAVQDAAEQALRTQARQFELASRPTTRSAPAPSVGSSRGAELRERQKNFEPLADAFFNQLVASWPFIRPEGADARAEFELSDLETPSDTIEAEVGAMFLGIPTHLAEADQAIGTPEKKGPQPTAKQPRPVQRVVVALKINQMEILKGQFQQAEGEPPLGPMFRKVQERVEQSSTFKAVIMTGEPYAHKKACASRKKHYYGAPTSVATTCESEFHELQKAHPEHPSVEEETDLIERRARLVQVAMQTYTPAAIEKCRNNPENHVWIPECVRDLDGAVLRAVETGFQNEAEHHLENGTFYGACGGPKPGEAAEARGVGAEGPEVASGEAPAALGQLTAEALKAQLQRFSSRVQEAKAREVTPEYLAVGELETEQDVSSLWEDRAEPVAQADPRRVPWWNGAVPISCRVAGEAWAHSWNQASTRLRGQVNSLGATDQQGTAQQDETPVANGTDQGDVSSLEMVDTTGGPSGSPNGRDGGGRGSS